MRLAAKDLQPAGGCERIVVIFVPLKYQRQYMKREWNVHGKQKKMYIIIAPLGNNEHLE